MSTNRPMVALSVDASAAHEKAFRVVPVGEFQASDGRPGPGLAWRLSPSQGQAIATDLDSRGNAMLIDYEHKTIQMQPGELNPAAGWIKQLEMRADGLYAVDVQWTEQARQMIQSGAYRYISPVLLYDTAMNVTGLHSVALTNNPALTGLTDLAAVALTAAGSIQDKRFAGLDPEARALLERELGMTLEQAAAEEDARTAIPPTPPGIEPEDWMKLHRLIG